MSDSNLSPFPMDGGTSGITRSGAGKYPNPFCDISSEYVPRDLNIVFEWMEYLFLTFGTVRTAARRVVRYFLTEVVLEGESDNEREKYEKFLHDELNLMNNLANIGDDYMCFHGDTLVVAKDGIFPIRELEGKTVDVLSEGGKYRSAEFKSFGTQELMEVEFSDGRTVLATPEHQWTVLNMSSDKMTVPTAGLLPGYRIERTVAPRPPKNDEFMEGVRHGFVFGDGTAYNKTRKTPHSKAMFYGEKDKAMLPYFECHGNPPVSVDGLSYARLDIHGLPAHYKDLPSKTVSASYWYGFVCGFLAADGSVDTYGCCVLTQASKATLEAIVEQLPRIGMAAGPIRTYEHDAVFQRDDGSESVFEGMSYSVVTLLKRFMTPDDLIIEAHKGKFVDNASTTNYGKYIRVKSVKPTGLTDKVYCCVEPETHTFVIDNGILTGNCYGNVFVSIYFPFDRFLICPHCGMEYHTKTIDYKFNLADGKFSGNCMKCNKENVEFKREDRRSPDKSRVRIIRWNPKYMRLRHHPISGKIDYFLEMEPLFVNRLRAGEKFYIDETPWSMIEACRTSAKDAGRVLFKFRDDAIFHFRDATLAGMAPTGPRGWAIPPMMPNFRLAYYIQLLRRYDEAIALDFIMPFRVIYPDMNKDKQGSDPLSLMSMGNFISHMTQMVENKRKNITDIQIAPFPIGYQMLGGEAKTLAPKDSIAQAIDELLNALGFPAELYRGSLSIQAFPVALRLFEKTWGNLIDGMNDFVRWLLERLARHFMWGPVTGELRSVTLADDIERKALALQAAAGMDISKATAYRPLGIDYLEEQRRVVEEQEEIQKLQQEAMERQQASQGAPSGGGGGGQPQGGGGATTQPGATPGDVYEQGKALAQQLLLQTPPTARRGQLVQIKHTNPTLHAIVLQEMNNMRQQFASQGQQAMMQQAGAKQASAIDMQLDKIPSPMLIGILLSDQICDYTRKDLAKIAMDIRAGVPYAKEAFHFIFEKVRGLT